MAFQLDIKTIIISFVFGNLFTVLLITAYRARSSNNMASTLFVVSKWLQLFFWCSMLIWDNAPHWLAIPLSNALLLAGGGLEIAALLLMMGKLGQGTKIYYLALTVCSTLGYVVIALFFNHSGLRIASASFWAALFVAYPAYHLTADRSGSSLQKILGSLYYTITFILLARATVALVWEPEMNVFTANLIQHLYYLGMYLLMIMGTAGFIVLSDQQSHEEMKRVAAYDELTGILSRGAFLLEAGLKLSTAVKKQEDLTLLLLDIDHFKDVNDTYGHDAGDRVLKDFSLTIEENLGNSDLFGRFGGEEFAVLLSGCGQAAGKLRAEQLREAVMNARTVDLPLQYTVSIGAITVKPKPYITLEMLYKLADRALYRAKKTGRNRVVLFCWQEG